MNYSTDMKIFEAKWANKLEPQGIMGIIILFRSLFYYSLRYRSDDMQALHFNFTWIIQMQHIGLGIEKKIGWLECANFYLRSLIVYYMPHLIFSSNYHWSRIIIIRTWKWTANAVSETTISYPLKFKLIQHNIQKREVSRSTEKMYR